MLRQVWATVVKKEITCLFKIITDRNNFYIVLFWLMVQHLTGENSFPKMFHRGPGPQVSVLQNTNKHSKAKQRLQHGGWLLCGSSCLFGCSECDRWMNRWPETIHINLSLGDAILKLKSTRREVYMEGQRKS